MKNHIKTIVVLLTIILLVTRVCGMTIVWAQEEKQEDRILKTLEEQAEDIESVNEGQVTKSIPDCDVWMADTMIFGFNNDQNGIYPMFQSFSEPIYKQLGGYLLEDEPLVVMSTAWSVYFNNEYRNQFFNEQKYIYEVLLMEYIKYDAESENISVELENNETKLSMKLYALLSEELADNTADYIDGMTVGEAVDFYNNVKIAEDLNTALSKVKKHVDNIKDLIDMMSEYLALQQVKEERIYLLKAARDACVSEDSPNQDFIKAADELIDIFQKSTLDYVQGKALDYLWNQGCDFIWDKLCDANPVLKTIGLDVSGLDVCFDTTNSASNNLKLALLYTADCYLKQGMMSAASDYMGSRTAINAQTFLACFKAYIQFQMYGNEFSNVWMEDYLNSGVIGSAINNIFYRDNIATVQELLSLSNSQTKMREGILRLINKYVKIYQGMYKSPEGNTVVEKEESKKDENESSDASRDVVLVLDRSGSMSGEPLNQTKEAAVKFVDTVFEKDSRVAVVTYDDTAAVECGLTDSSGELQETIENIYDGGGTNTYAGLEQADEILQGSQADRKIIMLMSDGFPNEGPNDYGDYSAPLVQYAEEMKDRGYIIYTLGFFGNVDPGYLYSAQQMMGGVASPGLHYEVNSAEDLVFFFDDIANQIGGKRYVYVRIACPVDVTVSSGEDMLSSKAESENTRTSFGTLTYENIQDGPEEVYDEYGYYEEPEAWDRVKILRLDMDQDYDIQIEGYDSGTMDYTVKFPNESGEYDDIREFPGIAVTASTKAISNTGELNATYLKVDENGDGKFETTYKTESNGTMEEVKDHAKLYMILAVIVAIAILAVFLAIVLVSISRRKKIAVSGMGAAGNFYTPTEAVYGAFGIFNGRSYPMAPGQRCTVGRKSICDIQLAHSQVSRLHCVIEMLPDNVYQVTDYSSNGTFYNDQRLKSREPYRLPKGALLAIGDADNVLELR